MRRRDFIAYGSAGVLSAALVNEHPENTAEAQVAAGFSFDLELVEVFQEMIDGEVLFALALRDQITRALRPILNVVEGANVTFRITNRTRKARRFALAGLADDFFAPIPAGGSIQLQTIANEAGTYCYLDNSEQAASRVAGFHGMMVIAPSDGKTPTGTRTPYNTPTAAQSMLFDALGTARFPGEKWRPDLPSRTRTWVFNAIDPVLQQQLELGREVDQTAFLRTFYPRYFTLNGLSGYDSAHDKDTVPRGYVGEPVLIRCINMGLCTHSPHIHGNHVFRLSSTSPAGGVVKNQSIPEVDTWMLGPLARVDVLLPFVRPDDIPEKAWPPKQEKFPLKYPMHCHMEMSQTARGGQYPQGMITDWELLGDRRGGAL
ncbi:MAG: hypothetical protein Q8R82_15180 [Hyphomonadaceae bacterium]|nr:hypothetical protein [Hyphomonadaceae bacterium]